MSGAVGGCLGLLAGVCGPLSVPTCFRFRHVNQAGLRLHGQALGCVRDHSGQRQAVKAGVRL